MSDSKSRVVQVKLPKDTHMEVKLLCAAGDIRICDWVSALIDDALSKYKDEDGNLILDDDDDDDW